MNVNTSRLDLIAFAVVTASLALLVNHLPPSARTVETRSALAVVISPSKPVSNQNDPEATVRDAVPDANNWRPQDGESHYGDSKAQNKDQGDDDDDLDDSYEPPAPADTVLI